MFKIKQYIEYDKNYNIVYYCERDNNNNIIYWERFYYKNNQIEYSQNSNNVQFYWNKKNRLNISLTNTIGSLNDYYHDTFFEVPDGEYLDNSNSEDYGFNFTT